MLSPSYLCVFWFNLSKQKKSKEISTGLSFIIFFDISYKRKLALPKMFYKFSIYYYCFKTLLLVISTKCGHGEYFKVFTIA